MNFRTRSREEPEINLIPFIDVLLVVLIFLMLSTTYSKFTELQLTLPVADADAQRDYPKEVLVTVTSEGAYAVNKVPVVGRSLDVLAAAAGRGQGRQGIGGDHQCRCQRQAPGRGHRDGSGPAFGPDTNHLCHSVLGPNRDAVNP